MNGAAPRHHGILLVDKEPGWTSHDVVARVRRLFGQKKVGHTGTLDPAATGLLVVCLGKVTRVIEYMVGHDKDYCGVIQLGVTTDTDDAEGQVIDTRPMPVMTDALLEETAGRFRGPISQVPPQYSAIKSGGERAYAVARRGEQPRLDARMVTIHELGLERREGNALGIRVRCTAGTYIRSLARDIGADLGCGGHLASLRRTMAGDFHVSDALTLGAIEEVPEDDRGRLLLASWAGLGHMPRVTVSPEEALKIATGLPVEAASQEAVNGPHLVFDGRGVLIGVGTISGDGKLRCSKVFAPVDEIQSTRPIFM